MHTSLTSSSLLLPYLALATLVSVLFLDYENQVPKLLDHLFLLPEKFFPEEDIWLPSFLPSFRCFLKWRCMRQAFPNH